MALSNYPPGVTGFEYEIAGPDFECPDEQYCERCGSDQKGIVAGYRGDQWFTCDRCDEVTDLFEERF
ncbi:MAG: hypothetical protein DLM66_12885 [Candidatus Dormiibacter spiritus]|nr:MAG: hypothetical protein DLM66_12885 [Candidatus Dormibacteraeota bacterium]